jgi:murein DD-endopeptidase MepM/ murein hydrolase activator NlpD
MKFIKVSSLFFFLCWLVIGCSQKAAPVIENSKNIYNHKSTHKSDPAKKKNSTTHGLDKKTPDSDSKPSKKLQNNQITVIGGETLFSISKKHDVLMRDLIKENNLSAPYNLKAGDRLKIPTPNYYVVKSGDTLYSISRANNMSMKSLITINDLKEPYNVVDGQKIRITSDDNNNKIAVAKNSTIANNNNSKSTSSEKAPEDNLENNLENKANNFSWPVNNGKIISGFGPKKGGLYNDGINIAVKENDPVKVSESGVVAYVGNELKGYGNLVIVKHSGGWITAYAHLSKSFVKRGQKVKKLQIIANAGTTGNVNNPQLYFGLRKGRDAVNPQNYLKTPIKNLKK